MGRTIRRMCPLLSVLQSNVPQAVLLRLQPPHRQIEALFRSYRHSLYHHSPVHIEIFKDCVVCVSWSGKLSPVIAISVGTFVLRFRAAYVFKCFLFFHSDFTSLTILVTHYVFSGRLSSKQRVSGNPYITRPVLSQRITSDVLY